MTVADVTAKARQLYRGEALAPMVRASTTPLRILALDYGADFVYTEELVDRCLIESIRVENKRLGTIDYVKDTSKMSKKQLKRLGERPALILRIDRHREGGKLVCQLGSGEPDLALAAALHVHQDVDAIDVNMGCPKKFSVSGGMGSALLKDIPRACRIISTLTDALTPLGVPVSAKIRLLNDVQSTVDLVTALVEAGAKAVAIHGRRVGDESTTPADWKTLQEVVKQCTNSLSVPILVNGDFYTRDEWVDFQQRSSAAGVLLARPALYNASIFCKPPTDSDAKHSYNSPLLLDKTKVAQDYIRQCVRYDMHHKNVKYVICEMMSNRRNPPARVPCMLMSFPGGQTINKTCDCHDLKSICKLWGVDYEANLPQEPAAEEAMPAGEHKYLDSYFLKDERDASASETVPEPEAKRVRVES